jgi:hypothetical protein
VTVKDLHEVLHEYLRSQRNTRIFVRVVPPSEDDLNSQLVRTFLDTRADGEVCLVLEGSGER